MYTFISTLHFESNFQLWSHGEFNASLARTASVLLSAIFLSQLMRAQTQFYNLDTMSMWVHDVCACALNSLAQNVLLIAFNVETESDWAGLKMHTDRRKVNRIKKRRNLNVFLLFQRYVFCAHENQINTFDGVEKERKKKLNRIKAKYMARHTITTNMEY